MLSCLKLFVADVNLFVWLQDEEHHPRTGVTSNHTKKELHQRLAQLQQSTDTSSSNDSLNALQSASHHVDENIIGMEATGGAGPTTRRAWQDYCKSGNNSHHESHSEEDNGNFLRRNSYAFFLAKICMTFSREIGR